MDVEAIGQTTEWGADVLGRDGERPVSKRRGDIARRLRERIHDGVDSAHVGIAADRAAKQAELRPAYHRAVRLVRDTQRDLENAEWDFGKLCADFVLGRATEEQVAAADDQLEELRALSRIYGGAVRHLGDDLGMIRDTSGNDLSIRRG
jgi:hypothetical protein